LPIEFSPERQCCVIARGGPVGAVASVFLARRKTRFNVARPDLLDRARPPRCAQPASRPSRSTVCPQRMRVPRPCVRPAQNVDGSLPATRAGFESIKQGRINPETVGRLNQIRRDPFPDGWKPPFALISILPCSFSSNWAGRLNHSPRSPAEPPNPSRLRGRGVRAPDIGVLPLTNHIVQNVQFPRAPICISKNPQSPTKAHVDVPQQDARLDVGILDCWRWFPNEAETCL